MQDSNVLNSLENLSNIYRVCLIEYSQMLEIFDVSNDMPVEENIPYKIYYITNIKIEAESDLPRNICKNCHTLLQYAFYFKKTFCKSEITLRSKISKNETETTQNIKIDTLLNEQSLLNLENKEYLSGNSMLFPVQNFKNCPFNDESLLTEEVSAEKIKSITNLINLTDSVKEQRAKDRGKGKIKLAQTDVKRSSNLVENYGDKTFEESSVLSAHFTDEVNITKNIAKKRNHIKKCAGINKVNRNKKPKRTNKHGVKQVCRLCNIWFENAKQKYEHRKLKHTPSDRICHYCGASVHYFSMSLHVASHLPPKYTCDLCGYRASIRSSFKKHLLIHTGAKDYKCEACGKAYRTSSSLRAHARMTHLQEKKYACEHCGKRFFDKKHLRRHLATHSAFKEFTCDVCGMSFSRRYVWVAHAQRAHNLLIPTPKPGKMSRYEAQLDKNEANTGSTT